MSEEQTKKEQDDFWDQLYASMTPASDPTQEVVDDEKLAEFVEQIAPEVEGTLPKRGRKPGSKNKKNVEPGEVMGVMEKAGADSKSFQDVLVSSQPEVPAQVQSVSPFTAEQVEEFLMAAFAAFQPYIKEFLKKNRP